MVFLIHHVSYVNFDIFLNYLDNQEEYGWSRISYKRKSQNDEEMS